MDTATKVVLAAAIGIGGFFLLKSTGVLGVSHPKFKVGNHITSIAGLPTDIEYVIMAVYPGPAPDYGSYTMGQWIDGQVQFITEGYPVIVIDDNYRLVGT